MDTNKEIVVVGGSLAGLMHAVVLRSLGHNVYVLEKSAPEVLQSQASGLGCMPDVRKFIEEYTNERKPYAITLETIEFMNEKGEIFNRFPPADPYYLTTWSILYRIFKSALMNGEKGPKATYQTSKQVQAVDILGEKVKVAYTDTLTETSNVLEADIVIAADGAHSSIRNSILPEVSPQYAGYVTWRGAVAEDAVPESTRSIFHNRAINTRTQDGFAISYYVPAENGSLANGECQFIWVWYQKLPEGEELQEILTDCNNRKHLTTIPRGQMRGEVWEKTLQRGRKLLSPPFVELLERTQNPFISAIRHFKSPKSVFGEGKVLLVGDAFTLFRPHAACSTNQAARQAISLAEVLKGDITFAEWEQNAIDYANRFTAISDAFGEYCFTGVVPPLLRAVIPSEE